MTNIKIGAWPRYGETNPRNTYMYDELEKLGYEVIDLKKNKYRFGLDYVHFHWPEKAFKNYKNSIQFLLYVFIIKMFKTKILWTVHNDVRFEINSNIKMRLFMMFLSMVDLLLLPSPSSLKMMKKIGNEKPWKILPLGLYSRTNELKDKNVFDKHLIIGRLTKKKGIIKTINNLIKTNQGENFLIVGQPESVEFGNEIKQACKELKNVEINFGFISDTKFDTYVKGSKSILLDYPEVNLNSGVATYAATYNIPLFIKSESMRRDLKRIYNIKSSSTDVFPKIEKYKANYHIKDVAKRLAKILR